MRRWMLAGLAMVVLSSGSGCGYLSALLCCCSPCGYYGGCGGCGACCDSGCESYPWGFCASESACCEPCDHCGHYTGPPHDYHPSYHGGYPHDAHWEDHAASRGSPTPAEQIPPPQGSQTRRYGPPRHY